MNEVDYNSTFKKSMEDPCKIPSLDVVYLWKMLSLFFIFPKDMTVREELRPLPTSMLHTWCLHTRIFCFAMFPAKASLSQSWKSRNNYFGNSQGILFLEMLGTLNEFPIKMFEIELFVAAYMSSPCHVEVILAEKEEAVAKPIVEEDKKKKVSQKKLKKQKMMMRD